MYELVWYKATPVAKYDIVDFLMKYYEVQDASLLGPDFICRIFRRKRSVMFEIYLLLYRFVSN